MHSSCLKGPSGRVKLLALLYLAGAVTGSAAFEGDPFTLGASSALSHDDNLVRAPAGAPVVSDSILTDRISAGLRLRDGGQAYDASASVQDGRYRHYSSQDYRALDAFLGAATDIGPDAHVSLGLRQAQALASLSDYQALVRDLVTTRTASLVARRAVNALDAIDGSLTRTTSTNDNPQLKFNDVSVDAESLGLVHAIGEGSQIGVRGEISRGHYTDVLAGLAASSAPYDPDYIDRRLELSGRLSVTPISRLAATVALVERRYAYLIGQDVHGTLGSLGADTDSGGPLSGGVAIRRELGAQGIPASRQVPGTGLLMHVKYAFSAVLKASAQLDSARRQYGIDTPGLPAHRENQSTLTLALDYLPWRYLGFELLALGDWRRANPPQFGYTDRQISLIATLTPWQE